MSCRHLNVFQHQAYMHARVPRLRSARYAVKTVSVPWARPSGGFTLLFEPLIMALVSAMPVNTVALLVVEHDIELRRSSTMTSSAPRREQRPVGRHAGGDR
jgi:transposase